MYGWIGALTLALLTGLFDRADENKDGFLTLEEIRNVAAAQVAGPGGRGGPQGAREGPHGDTNFIRMDPAAALRKLDQDGDGRITREEAAPAMGRRRGF